MKGGAGPWHRQARAAAGQLYDSIVFGRLRFTIEDDVRGWSFEALAR